jgi:hypothetical protein
MDPEDANNVMRELCFRLASSPEVVAVTVTKADPVTRLLDGRLKMSEDRERG